MPECALQPPPAAAAAQEESAHWDVIVCILVPAVLLLMICCPVGITCFICCYINLNQTILTGHTLLCCRYSHIFMMPYAAAATAVIELQQLGICSCCAGLKHLQQYGAEAKPYVMWPATTPHMQTSTQPGTAAVHLSVKHCGKMTTAVNASLAKVQRACEEAADTQCVCLKLAHRLHKCQHLAHLSEQLQQLRMLCVAVQA
jgi:hypothetical protein